MASNAMKRAAFWEKRRELDRQRAAEYKPPVIGEVRGPQRSSPGNPMTWQAHTRGPNGWITSFGTSAEEVLRKARECAASLQT